MCAYVLHLRCVRRRIPQPVNLRVGAVEMVLVGGGRALHFTCVLAGSAGQQSTQGQRAAGSSTGMQADHSRQGHSRGQQRTGGCMCTIVGAAVKCSETALTVTLP